MSPKRFRKIAIVAAFSVAALPVSAELKYENATGGDVVLYGHFNPAYLSYDDGVQKKSLLVDSAHSNSRVGLWVRQPMGGGNFSFNFETGLGLRLSSLVNQRFTPKSLNWKRTAIRKVDFAWESDSFGKFSLGQGSMATDGVAQKDLSGTTLVLYSSVPDTAGAFEFRDAAGNLTPRFIAGLFSDFDGGRRGRIRYDSPDFNGFKISIAHGEEILLENSNLKNTDIALTYQKSVGDLKMAGGLGYAETDSGLLGKFNTTIGSFSILHNSGFNATVAAGKRDNEGSYGYAKIGYIASWFGVGTTALAVDYMRGKDRSPVAGSKSTTYGIGVVQRFDDARVEAYLGLRNYQLTEPGTSYQDGRSMLVGARWKF